MVRTYPTILSCIIANDIYIGYREIDVIREPPLLKRGYFVRAYIPARQEGRQNSLYLLDSAQKAFPY